MKYNSESFTEGQYEVYKKIREKLYYIINENGITFED